MALHKARGTIPLYWLGTNMFHPIAIGPSESIFASRLSKYFSTRRWTKEDVIRAQRLTLGTVARYVVCYLLARRFESLEIMIGYRLDRAIERSEVEV